MSYNRRYYKPKKSKMEPLKKLLRSDADLMVAFKHRKGNNFITSVFNNALKWELSDKQKDSLRRAGAGAEKFAKMKEETAKKLETAPAIKNGKYAFVGTVVSMKEKDTRFGYVWKMLIESSSGNKLWGSVPRNLIDNLEKGMRVKLKAKVTRSDKDAHFGFFSRPGDAEIVES